MNTNYKSSLAKKWFRRSFSVVCLSAFLLASLTNANAQSGSLPILFFSQRDDVRGNQLGFLRMFGMNTNGSNQARIGDADLFGFFPRYSPDRTKIVFVSSVPDSNSPFFAQRQQIFVMNADGTNPVNISNDALHHHNAPAWFPNGRLAFISFELDFSGSSLWTMNADGTNRQMLYVSSGLQGAWYPSVSPDNTKIAFSDDPDGDIEVYVINADGTNLRQLTNNTGSHDYGVDWSPDGARIVFNRERLGNYLFKHPGINNGSTNGGSGDIYIMNSDGTGQTRLTRHGNDDFYPIFSPDGTKIVFSRANGWLERNIDVHVMNSDGSNVIRLTHEPGWDIASDWR